MHYAFTYERIGVIVGPWWEPGPPRERGARVEVRLAPDQPRRGSPSAAQLVVLDDPIFRADLFDHEEGTPGNLRAAHFHEGFDGVEPRDRQWPRELKHDPIAWLRDELSDLPNVLTRSGFTILDEDVVRRDTEALRQSLDAIASAVESTWLYVRSQPVASNH
ncbi:MAG TPA: hypothetical protein VGI86_08860 [Acidimicrobiia bacterium]